MSQALSANAIAKDGRKKSKTVLKRIWRQRELYLIMLIPLSLYLLFQYVPLYYVKWAFTNYGETIASQVKYIGFENFHKLFSNSSFTRALVNTILISVYGIAWGFPVPILMALFLDEMVVKWYKNTIQTIIYFPNFLSWVVVGSIWYMVLAPQDSINSMVSGWLGIKPIYFFSQSKYIRTLLVGSGIWMGAGYSAVIYLAALSGVDPSLFEASRIDGATRIQQIWHIKLPCISATIVTMFILSLSNILGVFDNVIVMATPVVYEKADVIMTLAYRTGVQNMKLGYGMAISVFKAAVSLVLVVITDRAAKAVGESGVF